MATAWKANWILWGMLGFIGLIILASVAPNKGNAGQQTSEPESASKKEVTPEAPGAQDYRNWARWARRTFPHGYLPGSDMYSYALSQHPKKGQLCKFWQNAPASKSDEVLNNLLDPPIERTLEEFVARWSKLRDAGECWALDENTEVIVEDVSLQKINAKVRLLGGERTFFVLKESLDCLGD